MQTTNQDVLTAAVESGHGTAVFAAGVDDARAAAWQQLARFEALFLRGGADGDSGDDGSSSSSSRSGSGSGDTLDLVDARGARAGRVARVAGGGGLAAAERLAAAMGAGEYLVMDAADWKVREKGRREESRDSKNYNQSERQLLSEPLGLNDSQPTWSSPLATRPPLKTGHPGREPRGDLPRRRRQAGRRRDKRRGGARAL